MAKKAAFAAGCFWGVQKAFEELKGVESTEVGYAGGFKENPTYKEVCNEDTGHAETVLIEYNEEDISYNDLLDKFWQIHDPTTKDRQGPDIGDQYKGVIFYYDEEQKEVAMKSREREQERYDDQIVTEIRPMDKFYKAEEEHQHYLDKKKE